MKNPFKAIDLCRLLEQQLKDKMFCSTVLEEAPFKDEGQPMTIQEMLTSINSGHDVLFLVQGTLKEPEPVAGPAFARGDRVCMSMPQRMAQSGTIVSRRRNRFDCYIVKLDGTVTPSSFNVAFLSKLADQEVAPVCETCHAVIKAVRCGRGGCRCQTPVPIDPRTIESLLVRVALDKRRGLC